MASGAAPDSTSRRRRAGSRRGICPTLRAVVSKNVAAASIRFNLNNGYYYVVDLPDGRRFARGPVYNNNRRYASRHGWRAVGYYCVLPAIRGASKLGDIHRSYGPVYDNAKRYASFGWRPILDRSLVDLPQSVVDELPDGALGPPDPDLGRAPTNTQRHQQQNESIITAPPTIGPTINATTNPRSILPDMR